MLVKHVRKRLTYANVMSTIAVFMLLGGAAIAASQVPKKSVGTKQLKANAVTAAKLKKNAVTAKKIKNKAVTTEKLADKGVTTAKIADAAVGSTQIAANAVGNTQTQFVKVFKGSVVSAAASEETAPRVELGAVGPFKFYGKCFIETGKVREKTYIELTSGQAALGSEDGAEMPKKTKQEYLTPATLEKERAMEDDAIAEANEATAVSNDEEFQATATDGTQITGLIGGTGAKQGSPAIGNGPFLAGDSCIVGTVAVFGG
ncbi:MAG: hypothetical protein WBM00_07285 [Solirubrobacterales bacterium]